MVAVLPFYQQKTRPEAGDCNPSCTASAIHWSSAGTIDVGIPTGGFYSNDTAAKKARRVAVVKRLRSQGGSAPIHASTSAEMYTALGRWKKDFKTAGRTFPLISYLSGGSTSYAKMVDALKRGKLVSVSVQYGPLDWWGDNEYDGTSVPSGLTCSNHTPRRGDKTDHPQFHEVSGQWCFDGNHQVLLTDYFLSGGTPWVTYMDPLTDGRVSSTSDGERVAKGLQQVPLNVMRHALSRYHGNASSGDPKVYGIIIPESKALAAPPGGGGGGSGGGSVGAGTGGIASLAVAYDGDELPVGEYSLRWRITDSVGNKSRWVSDHTLEVTEATDPVTPDLVPALDARPTEMRTKVRFVLYDIADPTHDDDNPAYDRGPGDVVAIIEDAINPGMSAYASSPGEVYFTLPLEHPQLHQCLPFQRHYAFQQWKRGEWKTLSEGLLHDIDLTDNDCVIYGYDWLGLLALSVESAHQPDARDDAEIGDGGSKYVSDDIDVVIESQLTRAITDEDSPVGFIGIGTIDPLPEAVTIYSAFVQRLDFIRGLIDSYKAGTGVQPRIRAKRDPADNDTVKFDLLEDSGKERPDIRLEFGGLMQGFELIPFGDFAVRVHGVGQRALSAKPLYTSRVAPGMDTQVWGNIAKTAFWQNVSDEADLARRVLERAAESARVGKRVAIAVRTRGLDPFDGWDLTDSIPLVIDRGPIETRFLTPDTDDDDRALTWWTIWGMEWRVFPDGHDELSLVVRPRIDAGVPLPDTANHPLLRFTALAKHEEDDWQVGSPEPDPVTHTMLVGIDTSTIYQRGIKATEVRAEGVDFHWVKASQGTYFGDAWEADVAARIRNGQAQGTVMGAYHFITRVLDPQTDEPVAFNTGAKQCDYFINHLPNNSPEGILCAIDVESNRDPASFTRNGKTYHPQEGGRRWTEVRDFVNRWFTRFPDHPLFIYSSRSQWSTLCEGRDVKALKPGMLYCWNAYYYSGNLKPVDGRDWNDAAINAMAGAIPDPWKPRWGGFSRTDIWQVGLLKVSGFGKVDGNACKYLSKAQLLALASDAVVAPPTQNRTDYRSGYNAVLTGAGTATTALALSGNTDYNSGVTDAKADVLAELATMVLDDSTDP